MKSFFLCLKASHRSLKLSRLLIDTMMTAANAACGERERERERERGREKGEGGRG
jgi:hypothetical protein